MGGIAGSQTLAVAIRGIALNHLHQSNLRLLVNKEVKIALINGVVMGAALSGTLIPFTLKKLNIDPAVAGSVVLTTVTDVVGFLVFLGLGAIFLV